MKGWQAGVIVNLIRDRFNQDVMIDCLSRLVRDAQRKVIVICDGHSSHKGKKLNRWLTDQSDECERVRLPAHACVQRFDAGVVESIAKREADDVSSVIGSGESP